MQIMRGLECELCKLACACRVSLLRLRRAMLRVSVPRFAACCVPPLRFALCCRAVPPRCCERVLRCARVMYTIVRMR